MSFRLIPFVCSAGASVLGTERACLDLSEHNVIEHLSNQGVDVSWHIDPHEIYDLKQGKRAHEQMPALGTPERQKLVIWHCEQIKKHVKSAVEAGHVPVTLGGDHAMAMGSIAGLAEACNAHGRIGVLWVDAHADLNTRKTSPSMAYHGMPLAALLGLGDPDFVRLGGDKPVLNPAHIYYMGIRDIDPGEQERLDDMQIRHMSVEEIEADYEAAFERAVQELAEQTDYLFLSLDLDSLDPQDAPAVGSPSPGGLRKDALLPALKSATKKYNFSGYEIVEYNPALNGADQTRTLIFDLLDTVLG